MSNKLGLGCFTNSCLQNLALEYMPMTLKDALKGGALPPGVAASLFFQVGQPTGSSNQKCSRSRSYVEAWATCTPLGYATEVSCSPTNSQSMLMRDVADLKPDNVLLDMRYRNSTCPGKLPETLPALCQNSPTEDCGLRLVGSPPALKNLP